MSSGEWKNNLRISKENFRVLLKMIIPFAVTRSSKVQRDVLSLEKRVVALHYLKDQGSMRMTTNAFGIARCTVGKIIQEICMILTKTIGPELIKFPETKEEVSTEISAFFNALGFLR